MTPVEAMSIASLRGSYERAAARWGNIKTICDKMVAFEVKCFEEYQSLGKQLELAEKSAGPRPGHLREHQCDRPPHIGPATGEYWAQGKGTVGPCTCETYMDGDRDPACPVHGGDQ